MFVTDKKGESSETFFKPAFRKVTEYNATANYDWRAEFVSPRKKKKPLSQANHTVRNADSRRMSKQSSGLATPGSF